MVGTRLGPYVVEALVGSGGMGEVYRGRDTRLGRSVAIKVLAHAASDHESGQRLEREARTIAGLSHPHICVLHDVGHQDGVDYLVMELVDGETLAARLTRGPLPIDHALQYAIEIAGALDKAHQHGVVHRDLKPGNIMITRSGTKLLDFGIAKLVQPERGDTPDVTTREVLTAPGTMVGTTPYMSPEQLQNRPIDARTDVFAFGAVLYEMLTARRAFAGDNTAAMIGAVLERDPAPIPAGVGASPALERAIRKCLAKDPDARWQTCRDLQDELRWIKETGAPSGVVTAARPRRVAASGWIAAAAIALFALAMRFADFGPDAPVEIAATFDFSFPDDAPGAGNVAISPDGRYAGFVARGREQRPQVWVRALDSGATAALEGTEGANGFSWSPDSNSIAFSIGTELKRISRSGGWAQTICIVPGGVVGTAWGGDNVILIGTRGGLARVSAAGGQIETISALDPAFQENSHRYPRFLPDSRRFLFVARSGRPDQHGAYLGIVGGPPPRRLFSAQSPVAFAPPGYLLFARDGVLLAQSIDPDTFEIKREPQVVASSVVHEQSSVSAQFSLSASGILTYRPGIERARKVAWVDRKGSVVETVVAAFAETISLSPDERQVAMTLHDERAGTRSIWIFDLASGAMSRLTAPSDNAWIPVWSQDAKQMVFSSYRDGPSNLFQRSTIGAGDEQVLLRSDGHKYAHDWSPDGRYVAYQDSRDIWALPLDGKREPFKLVNSPAIELFPHFSPDGRWIAYTSNESGTSEIWVGAFPPTGARWQISRGGGSEPRWRGDSRELCFIAAGSRMMAALVEPAEGVFRTAAPVELFQTSIVLGSASNNYEASRDAQRFLMIVNEAGSSPPVRVVLNWQALLNKE